MVRLKRKDSCSQTKTKQTWYKKKKLELSNRKIGLQTRDKVNRLGFEPKTYSLEGCCSIQLSYRSLFCAGKGKLKHTNLQGLFNYNH